MSIGHSFSEIIWKDTLMVIKILLQISAKRVFVPMVQGSLIDIKNAFWQRRSLMKDFHMMSKTNAQKITSLQIGRQWRPI